MTKWPVLVVALLPASAGAGADAWGPGHPLRNVQSETLVYRATSSKTLGPITVPIPLGTSEFTVAREEHDGEAQLVFRAHATGGVPGYPLDATYTARVREADFRMRYSEYRRAKPAYKLRVLRFHDRGADYLKHKHCDAPSLCHNPKHLIDLPDGTRGHCMAFGTCRNVEHYVWCLRFRHRFEGQAWDMLAGLYLARGLPMEVGGEPPTIRVINNRTMWDVGIEAVAEETITVPAGQFDCYRVRFVTEPANDYAKAHEDDAEGPFGIHGGVTVHVDKATGQIVRVHGKVKLGATFEVRSELIERQVEPLPAPAP